MLCGGLCVNTDWNCWLRNRPFNLKGVGLWFFVSFRKTDLIIMDFAKAFDKVSHRRLLYKLEYYGIQTHTLNWIQAFLSDRTQTVVIDDMLFLYK
jgi:hypothetical protein